MRIGTRVSWACDPSRATLVAEGQTSGQRLSRVLANLRPSMLCPSAPAQPVASPAHPSSRSRHHPHGRAPRACRRGRGTRAGEPPLAGAFRPLRAAAGSGQTSHQQWGRKRCRTAAALCCLAPGHARVRRSPRGSCFEAAEVLTPQRQASPCAGWVVADPGVGGEAGLWGGRGATRESVASWRLRAQHMRAATHLFSAAPFDQRTKRIGARLNSLLWWNIVSAGVLCDGTAAAALQLPPLHSPATCPNPIQGSPRHPGP
jgi:hypothetical protein